MLFIVFHLWRRLTTGFIQWNAIVNVSGVSPVNILVSSYLLFIVFPFNEVQLTVSLHYAAV